MKLDPIRMVELNARSKPFILSSIVGCLFVSRRFLFLLLCALLQQLLIEQAGRLYFLNGKFHNQLVAVDEQAGWKALSLKLWQVLCRCYHELHTAKVDFGAADEQASI